MSGVVLSKHIEPGEFVAPGNRRVNRRLGPRLASGVHRGSERAGSSWAKGKVTTDTYPGKVYEGYVSFIADKAEFTPKNVQTEKERVKLVYRIKIDITNPKGRNNSSPACPPTR